MSLRSSIACCHGRARYPKPSRGTGHNRSPPSATVRPRTWSRKAGPKQSKLTSAALPLAATREADPHRLAGTPSALVFCTYLRRRRRARHGGRFQPDRGRRPSTPRCAWRRPGWRPSKASPSRRAKMTLCGYGVDCEDIADLTDSATRATLGIDLPDLGCAWEDLADRGTIPPSWEAADRLIAAGHAGILVPSFAAGAHRPRCQRRVLAVVDRSPASGRSHRRHRPAAAERSPLLAVTPIGHSVVSAMVMKPVRRERT